MRSDSPHQGTVQGINGRLIRLSQRADGSQEGGGRFLPGVTIRGIHAQQTDGSLP